MTLVDVDRDEVWDLRRDVAGVLADRHENLGPLIRAPGQGEHSTKRNPETVLRRVLDFLERL